MSMARGKKGQSSMEAAAIIALFTFFLIVAMAAVSDDVMDASNDNYRALLQNVADFVEEQARIALNSENGYRHEFFLPETLNNNPYSISMINSTSSGSNFSELVVSSGDSGTSLSVTKVLAGGILGNLEIGKVTMSKENGQVIIKSVPKPKVISVDPASGSIDGGTVVAITGTNFVATPDVLFGGVEAISVIFINSNTVTASTPAHAVGTVDVTVINPDGQSGNLLMGFTYAPPPPPTILDLNPPVGIYTGGTLVTITGTNFVATPTVSFGGVASPSVTWVSSTELSVVTPAHAVGTVDVVVTNPDGQSGNLLMGFTYVLPPPAISSINPKIGPSSGGTTVTVTGSNFVATPTVSFGGITSPSVTFIGPTTLTAMSPAGGVGFVSIQVVNPDGQSASLSNAFLYRIEPVPVGAVFVTSATYTGVLGGLAGGDSKCQALANAGNFGGTWKAWLSDSSTDAKDRITDTAYKRLDNVAIAGSKADLTDGTITNPISLTDSGTVATGFAWTGTLSNGVKAPLPTRHCNGWTEGFTFGISGKPANTDLEWTESLPTLCLTPDGRLYCFRTS